jgi:hypothetical protein
MENVISQERNEILRLAGESMKDKNVGSTWSEMYYIYDSVGGVYIMPMDCRNLADALRQLRAMSMDERFSASFVFKNPKDFRLVKLFDFNQNTGEVKQDVREIGTVERCIED